MRCSRAGAEAQQLVSVLAVADRHSFLSACRAAPRQPRTPPRWRDSGATGSARVLLVCMYMRWFEVSRERMRMRADWLIKQGGEMSAVAAWKDALGSADRQVKTRAYGMGCCISSFVSSLRQGSRHDEHQRGGGI